MIELFGRLYAPDDRGPSLVRVEDGVIASIDAAAAPTPGAIGHPGARIVPGLLDIQLNGAFGQDFADPAADLGLVGRGLPRFGVTGYVPTVVTSAPGAYGPALANLRRRPELGEARPLGAHLEGPCISPRHPGTHDPALLRAPDIAEARSWLESGDILYVTLAPELPGALALTSFLAGRGVRVSMGHTDATWAEAEAAVAAGASQATHLFNAMRPLRHRDPGVAGLVLATHLPAGVIADGNHLAFEMLRVVARAKGADEVFLVTDGLSGLGLPPGAHRLANREYVSDGTAGRLADGTLSGSLLPLNRALRNLVDRVGLEPAAAVRMATLNPARTLGLDRSIGRIEVGRTADLVLLDESWEVEATVIGGRLAFDAGIGDGAAASLLQVSGGEAG
ncbi:MAG: N-acetylglucosamine-6-phosphate deacetylase [Candidatus Limnocylindrales bacterium]